MFRLVLWPSGAEGIGERAPERVEAGIEHIEIVADIRWLAADEEGVGLRGVGIRVAGARQHAERDERVEEVSHGARMQLEARGERCAVQWTWCEGREEADLHGTQEGLGAPKADREIDKGCWSQGFRHVHLV